MMRRFTRTLATAATVALLPTLAPVSAAGGSRGGASGGGLLHLHAATGSLLNVSAASSESPDVRAAKGGWAQRVPFHQLVVSAPTSGGGYPGAEPSPGGCVKGAYDSNFSEGALALRPGTERLVGGSKAFFGRWSTFKASHTVSFAFSRAHRGPERSPRLHASTHFVGGFDCISTGTQAMPPSWTNVTDPNVVWDARGRVYQLILAYNAYWGSVEQPNGNLYSVYSDNGGRTWLPGNGGRPVEAGPDLSVDSATYLDKPWITANPARSGPRASHVYGAWVLFTDSGAEIHTAVSRDRGRSWSRTTTVPTPQALGPSNPWPMIAVGPHGMVYLSYVSYGTATPGASSVPATLWSARSADDGRTWGEFHRVTTTTVIGDSTLPGTTVHRTVVQYLAVSPDRPGHLYVVWNRLRHRQVDVMLSTSRDSGRTWTRPRRVNDDAGSAHQFSATVAAGTGGAVAVGFYDMRASCPRHDPAILPADRGRPGTCIGLSLQAYHDSHGRLVRTTRNALVSRHLWDPYQPGQTRGGLPQQACEDAAASCDDIFVGDYFSMQVSRSRVYLLSTSTHPVSRVRGDDGRRLHYQQQVLTTVPRRQLGVLDGSSDESLPTNDD
jgi:hypothetical protein